MLHTLNRIWRNQVYGVGGMLALAWGQLGRLWEGLMDWPCFLPEDSCASPSLLPQLLPSFGACHGNWQQDERELGREKEGNRKVRREGRCSVTSLPCCSGQLDNILSWTNVVSSCRVVLKAGWFLNAYVLQSSGEVLFLAVNLFCSGIMGWFLLSR